MMASATLMRRAAARPWGSRMAAGRLFSSSSLLVELREDRLNCARAEEYSEKMNQHSDLVRSISPLRLFSLPQTGGRLDVATHLYTFGGGHKERDAVLAQREWQDLKGLLPLVEERSSLLFVEAPLVADFGLHGMQEERCPGGDPTPETIYELRRYQLRLGYDAVPNFLALYAKGLPSKLNAPGTDKTTSLVTLLFSDVGALNEVIELWRHGGGTPAMEASRKAARAAAEWRQAIAEIAGLSVRFTTTIHKPLAFSPWR